MIRSLLRRDDGVTLTEVLIGVVCILAAIALIIYIAPHIH